LRRGHARAPGTEMDEPLFRRAKDHRLMTAPAMRIAMLHFSFGDQIAARLQQSNHRGIRLEYCFVLVLRQAFQKSPVIVERSVRLDPEFLADGKIFRAVSRSGMHDARTLFERDVLAENARHDALRQKWMLESRLQKCATRNRR